MLSRGFSQLVRATGAVLVAAFVVIGTASEAGAQGRPVTVTGNQAITFGTVFPGVPHSVSRTDALNSGQFQVRGQKDSEVQIQLTLPASLTGPGAAAMPLTFTAADGGYSQNPAIGSATGFDPRAPLVTRLSGQGRLYVFLGGRVSPPIQQRAGAYSTTITLTVSYTGN